MSLTYRKTDLGRHEIETRQARLSPRLRSLLILVDGRRTERDLRALVPTGLAEGLAELQSRGLIEVMASLETSASADASSGAPTARPRPQAQPALAVRYLTDRLGPLAESVSLRIEAARTPADLQAALLRAETMLRHASGRAVADSFRSLFIDPLINDPPDS
jgi:hypothetical protein